MNYATQDGTALAGSDYVAESGTLKFAPGETAKTVKVQLINDTLPEGAEAFSLALSGVVGATALNPVGTAVIAPMTSQWSPRLPSRSTTSQWGSRTASPTS